MQGLALATGEYVIHCDSDDELTSPDAYRLLYEKAVAERLDIVTCNYLKEDASGRRALVRGECKGVRDLLLDKAQGCLVVRLIRRTILQDGLLAPRGSMGEDLVQSVQATLRAGATGHLDEPLYLYRYCPVSITKLQGKEAAIRRHRELAANVRMLVDLLVGDYGYSEDAPEIVRFKYYARHCIEPYVGDKACYAMWKETFPEVDAKVLSNPFLSLEKKGWFILIHLHLYAQVKRLTRRLGKRRGQV
jgi:glycosyltransferase involved in cell wall biosynthesis